MSDWLANQTESALAATQETIDAEPRWAKLPWRDIHLDFHTHGLIPDVAADFNAGEFVGMLTEARVNAISVFARCHHGYCYYPTRIGTPHPHLKRSDLLGEMLAGLREAGISPGIYTTVVWDELIWANHPKWRVVTADSEFPRQMGSLWQWLCMNTGYADWFEAHLRELLERYRPDRFFIDIVMPWPDGCACNACAAELRHEGGALNRREDRVRLAHRVRQRFIERMSRVIASYDPNIRPFFNRSWGLTTDSEFNLRRCIKSYGYMTIESLPSGFWGYNHFPLLASYFAGRGLPLQAMTGRFHRMWGDFGGLKNPAALEYEIMRMVAWGIKAGIGDQLHPRGRLETVTYQRIGAVYRQIEALEPWLEAARPEAEVGILVAAGSDGAGVLDEDNRSEEGAMRMMMELGVPFLMVDETEDWSPYKALILPDRLRVGPSLKCRLEHFIAQGGHLIATYQSGLGVDERAGEFVVADWPAQWLDEGDTVDHYLRPLSETGLDLEEYDYVIYGRGARVTAREGSTPWARHVAPYFDRTPQHFCSHFQTPPTGQPGLPAILAGPQIIYFADPLFRLYQQYGVQVYKAMVSNALTRAIPRPLVEHNLPSTAELIVCRQGERRVLHILHYVPQRRGEIDIVEDILPLHDVRISLRSDRKPSRVYLAPECEPLPHTYADGAIRLTIAQLRGHVHIVCETE